MNKSLLMKKAHKIAKTLEGDYRARLSLALTQAWEEMRGEKTMVELKGSEKQVKWAMDIVERVKATTKGIVEALKQLPLREGKEKELEKTLQDFMAVSEKVVNEESAWKIIESYKGNDNLYEFAQVICKMADKEGFENALINRSKSWNTVKENTKGLF